MAEIYSRKIPNNRQMIDKVQTCFTDNECITLSLNTRLGLSESSLLGAQPVSIATVQSAQLTTNIPHNSPHGTEIGGSDNNEYQGDRDTS